MTIEQLAGEAGVSRDTLSDLESGTRTPRSLTVAKIAQALDSIEAEAGVGTPVASDEGPNLIEFKVSGDFGVTVVVRGPVSDADALERSVSRLIADIRKGSDPA